MSALVRRTAQLGEEEEAVFEKAAPCSADPKGVSLLATRAGALIQTVNQGDRWRRATP